MKEKLREIYRTLSREEKVVFDYFRKNVSVGEIIAIRELSAIYKIKNPEQVINSLIAKGLIERGDGCYNLAKELRIRGK